METQLSAEQAPALAAPEIILMILKWVGPRTVKRFGITCRDHYALIPAHTYSLEYALQLAHSAVGCIATYLANQHKTCPNVEKDGLPKRAQAFTMLLAADLAKSEQLPIAKWARTHVLHLVYPVAVAMPAIWPLAPYALEWCALYERAILDPELAHPLPREEVLALFQPDVLQRLAQLAAQKGWLEGINFTATAAALCPTATALTAANFEKILNKLAEVAAADASRIGDIPLCFATTAAATVYLPDGQAGMRNSARTCVFTGVLAPKRYQGVDFHHKPKKFWEGLCKVGGNFANQKLAPDDVRWLALTGFTKTANRAPFTLMGQFNCKTGGRIPMPLPLPRARVGIYNRGQLIGAVVGQVFELHEGDVADGAYEFAGGLAGLFPGGIPAAAAAGPAGPPGAFPAMFPHVLPGAYPNGPPGAIPAAFREQMGDFRFREMMEDFRDFLLRQEEAPTEIAPAETATPHELLAEMMEQALAHAREENSDGDEERPDLEGPQPDGADGDGAS